MSSRDKQQETGSRRAARSSSRCPWARSAPAGLCDAAEGWGMTRLPDVFARAHRQVKKHDDGQGHCRVCGGPMDLDAWLEEQDRLEDERRRKGGDRE